MRNPKIRTLIEAIEARYPGTRVVVQRFQCEEYPEVHWWLWILNVPERWTGVVEEFASRRTTKLFGAWPVPCFAGAVGRAETRKLFRAVLDMPKGRRHVEDGPDGWVPAQGPRPRRARVA